MNAFPQHAAIVIAAMAVSRAHAQGAMEFRIDAGHSTVAFEIPFMYSVVRGRFDDVRGSVVLPDWPGERASAGAMALVRVASINTGSVHRDQHLRSSDFFDAERFPYIVFRSEGISGSESDFVLSGSLSMHGVTRRVRIPCWLALKPVHDPHHVVIAEVRGAIMLARRDFGILGGDSYNAWFDKLRSATMGDSVRVSLEMHLWAPDPENPDPSTRATIARIDSIGIDSAVARLRTAYARDSAAVSASQASLDAVGDYLLAHGRTREAFLLLHQIARLLAHNADAMVSVGRANAAMGDTTRARQWYALARAADSLNTRAYVAEVSRR